MARPALATLGDLETLLGRAVEDSAQALARLGRASALVRAYAGRTWLDDDGTLTDVPEEIAGVVAGMVERGERNPEGITQESVGEYQRSLGADAAQRIYLDKNDKLIIDAAIGRPTGGLGTITTTRGPIETASVALPPGMDVAGW